MKCPKCGWVFAKSSKSYYCPSCSTPWVKKGRGLAEIEIACRKVGRIVPATFCRTCDKAVRGECY